ncbi:MAG: L-ascorbate metabolism protein UlaG, beta-lactamase superfamily [Blastococcus sp.]|nr:L-ascorbate metabolism protein UlaG, beta-lactamase superfamily [Blastococcus sp.]
MGGVRLTHIGGPTVLIEVAGWRLLTDPTFDPPGRRYHFTIGARGRKLTGPAIPAAEVLPIDAVLLSHDSHGDNLDDAGRALLPSAGVVVTTPQAAARLGGAARGLRPWESTELTAPGRPTIRVTATPGRHGFPLLRPLTGAVTGFALQGDGQDEALWISGDTVPTAGVREVADRFQVDTAILHLGAVRFPVTGPLLYSMTAREGVELCRSMRPRIVVPVHYEGWTHFREGPNDIDRAFARASQEIRDSLRRPQLGVALEV